MLSTQYIKKIIESVFCFFSFLGQHSSSAHSHVLIVGCKGVNTHNTIGYSYHEVCMGNTVPDTRW